MTPGTLWRSMMAPAKAALPPGTTLIYTQPGEAFSLYITVSLIAGAVIASPYIMLQVWLFIAPGLYAKEKRMAIPFVLLTTVGFIAGAAFNHYVAFRFIMVFFASFNSVDLRFMPRIEDVFGLYTKMLLGIGIVFQMPGAPVFDRQADGAIAEGLALRIVTGHDAAYETAHCCLLLMMGRPAVRDALCLWRATRQYSMGPGRCPSGAFLVS